MSTPAPPGAAIQEPPPPICPKCQQPMKTINGYPYMLGPFSVLAVLCTNCHALLHMQIFQNPPQQPAEGEPPPASPLWKPS